MMQNLHKEIVLDHYRRPRNKGEIPGADLEEHLLNPLCGDEVTVYARVENGRVAEVRFAGRGCAISQASASMLTGRLAGKSLAEAEKEIEAFLEMMRTEENGELGELGELAALRAVITAPNRIRCATLAWTAFQQGLQSSLPKG
jgi:nitrogen fixation protein NifU and related proteins